MKNVRRVYVEKKAPYAVGAKGLKEELTNYLNIHTINNVRMFVRYDIENISDEVYENALYTVFCEPPLDDLYEEKFPYDAGDRVFSIEYLPGQYDQRADSAEQCLKLLKEDEEPIIKTALTYVLEGEISDEEFEKIKSYTINPVDSRESSLKKPETLVKLFDEPADVEIIEGFITLNDEGIKELYLSLNLAMTLEDFLHIRTYYIHEEKRNPTMTEMLVLDTYWSDHCRHTTFQTELKNIEFADGDFKEPIVDSYERYLKDRQDVFGDREDKYVCLMDLALIAMRKLKKEGKLDDQEETDEINACSIIIPVEIDGESQEWLLNFKNETHNHPTEIEPFGGAATCLGGAIRDPLSGRTYVYQAMRVTGAADPRTSMEDTLKGKLPQKKIVTEAANGYSSYGNQIGLATGLVKEIYHPDYVAKRMEIGAVLGAAPRKAVVRGTADPGDVIVLLGGRTGRDGLGGATGSSKVHTEESIETASAEVQKGNPPTERKIQRLFRREEASRLIKKCNDFGAGGVSVAIGELADGLLIDLDKVPKKYAGLDGTEIAISESQERMAVVLDPKDVDEFLKYSHEENLEATPVAHVTSDSRLVLKWRGKDIVNISRAFLDTNGAHQESDVKVEMPDNKKNYLLQEPVTNFKERWIDTLSDLNVCSQKGLVEMFDASIGSGTVTMPYGGKYQLTETQAMVAKIPVLEGECNTVSMMTYGFNPYLSKWSPYHGAIYAVLESVAKIVASGGDHKKIRFTFQEYFGKIDGIPSRWSQPFTALLGAYDAQMGLGLPSIGGKDSMSGTFNEIDVPPTLVSFAVNTGRSGDIISPEFKDVGNKLVKFEVKRDKYDIPDYKEAKKVYKKIFDLIQEKAIVSAYALDEFGLASAISKMSFGNRIGVKLEDDLVAEEFFAKDFANIVAEVDIEKMDMLLDVDSFKIIGELTNNNYIEYRDSKIILDEAIEIWSAPLKKVFPQKSSTQSFMDETPIYKTDNIYICKNKVAKPTVFIPVFSGTNCEYDSARAFKNAGANVIVEIFRNLDANDIRESIKVFKEGIDKSQIIMFPGGFSAGDEPDGSAKFFAAAFRNEVMKESIHNLLNKRDGLALGICNGFQALIKLGLVPNGEITGQNENSPTLTYNTINRHVSKMVYSKVVSNKSPWMTLAQLEGVYVNPVSHGEGRFVASKEWQDKLFENGQVATQYVDLNGKPSMDEEWNINGSFSAIEGITSPDGRCLGKMLHVERIGQDIGKNIYGKQDMKIFESGVEYFKS